MNHITSSSNFCFIVPILASAVYFCGSSSLIAEDVSKPFVGRWGLDLPGGGAGWLGVEEQGGILKGTLLWGGGSVLPVAEIKLEHSRPTGRLS